MTLEQKLLWRRKLLRLRAYLVYLWLRDHFYQIPETCIFHLRNWLRVAQP